MPTMIVGAAAHSNAAAGRSPYVAAHTSQRAARRLTPQLLARKPRALGERFELRPHDRGMDPAMERALREAAVGAGDDVLTADELAEPHDPLGDERGMLDHISGVTDDARNEHLPLWQLDVLPHHPFMLVARIGT